jgi:hypothetical protein
MHDAIVFNIKGPSWRLREHEAPATAGAEPEPTQGRAHKLTPRGTLTSNAAFGDRPL